MDSLNFSETQNNSVNSKNVGSDTNSITCACCGSKYYMQYLPQPCCFRIHHPEMTKCKDPQKLFEENIKNPKPGFPPFPIFHPIFHNSLLPVNSCHVHNHVNDPAKNKLKKCESEHESLSRQGRNELRENITEAQDDAQKYVSGSESPILGHPLNLMDPHFNSFFQQTSWGDFMPWTYSPFFTPMMSYCLFWNSHKFAANSSFKNYPSDSGETERPNNKNTYQAPSNDNNDNKDIEDIDVKSYSPEGCLEVQQIKDQSRENIEDEKETVGCADTNSDSICGKEGEEAEFRTVEKEEKSVESAKTSSDMYKEEGDAMKKEFGNTEKVKEILECAKISSDSICREDEDAENNGFDSAVQGESSDHFDMDDKDLQNYKTCFLSEPEDNSSDKNQQLVESEIYLMSRQISENTVNSSASEIQVNLSDALPAEDNVFLSNQENQRGKPNIVIETNNYQEGVPFKKTFKNFTIADQTNDIFFNEAQISVAAAGDLGGENCVGYKVTIVPFEKNEEQVLPETEPTEFQQKDLELKGSKCQPKNALNDSVKNSIEKPKYERTSKTRIAKLLNNSKPKESKTDTLKISKQNVQSNQKEANYVRCKHNCLLNDKNIYNNNSSSSHNNNNNNIINNNNKVVSANEKALKIQKTKNCTVAEKQIQGPKKYSKETNPKNISTKGEKKLQGQRFQ